MRGSNIFICLVSMLAATACSLDQSRWEGIWRAETEVVQGFHPALEFELHKGPFSDEWGGRWEMAEFMLSGKLYNIEVSDSNIVMGLDPGSSFKFKGTLSRKKKYLDVLYYAPHTEVGTLKFNRVDDWSTKIPARVNENNQKVETWNYQVPELLDDGWPVASLSDVNISKQSLEELFQSAVEGNYQGLDTVLIAHKGSLVLEEYFHLGGRDRIHSIQSATKSVTSLLIGMAFDEGLISDLNLPVQGFFPSYMDSLKTNAWHISLKHTLMMSAVLNWREDVAYTDPRNDAGRMNISSDMYSYVLSRDMAQGAVPGKEFEYNSGLSILLGGAALDATGMSIDKYAEQTIFKKLGINSYYWLPIHGIIHTGGGLFLRPRDLLKLGQLVLEKGRWRGEQIVSEGWIKESTAFHLPAKGFPIKWSKRNWGYGYQWWREVFEVDQREFPAIFAIGYGWQILWVVPDLDLVVVALHHNPYDVDGDHSLNWEEMESIIIPSVLSN